MISAKKQLKHKIVTLSMIMLLGVAFCLTATVFSDVAEAGDHNHTEHHNEHNTETQTGMDNANSEPELNLQREQSRPTVRGP